MRGYEEVEVVIKGQERVFHFRPATSPAAVAFIERHEDMFATMKFDPKASTQERIDVVKDFREAIFPNVEQYSTVMEMVLDGDHTGIDWYLDARLIPMLAIVTDWLSRSIAELHEDMRETSERFETVAKRAEEAAQ